MGPNYQGTKQQNAYQPNLNKGGQLVPTGDAYQTLFNQTHGKSLFNVATVTGVTKVPLSSVMGSGSSGHGSRVAPMMSHKGPKGYKEGKMKNLNGYYRAKAK